MRPLRLVLLLTGAAIAGVGGVELVGQGGEDLWAALVWLAGGVLAHDLLLAPLVLGAAAAGTAVLPRWALAPAAAATVVLGSVTLMAVPVLGRFGARVDNPTLLDRPYLAGWAVFAGLVLACAAGWALARRAGGGG